MKKFTPNKKGFTLVEEVVSVVLIGILIVTASTIMLSNLRIFTRNVITLNAQEKGIAVMEQLEEHLKYASEIGVAGDFDTSAEPYKVKISVTETDGKYSLCSTSSFIQYSDGASPVETTNVLCNLGAFRTEYNITKHDSMEDVVIIDLKVYRGSTVYYSDRRNVKLMNGAVIKTVPGSNEIFIGSIE